MGVNVCPICGVETDLFIEASFPPETQHRCSEKTLRGIDSAGSNYDYQERVVPLSTRLAQGFKMMNGRPPY